MPQATCGKQVTVNAIQCAAMSTLEEADLAGVDCRQQPAGSGCKQHGSMYSTGKI